MNDILKAKIDKTYETCVGQDRVKRQLRFALKGLAHSKYLPHTLFIAERGAGKTHFAKETMGAIAEIRKAAHDVEKVRLVEVNGSTLTNLKALFESIVFIHLADRDAVLFIDEFDAIGDKVRAALLSIAAPSKSRETVFNYDGGDHVFNWRRISLIAATTEGHKIFPALRDRFVEINLETPTHEDLAEIMRRNLEDCMVHDDALLNLAPYCRGNCRSAVKMAANVSNFCTNNGDIHFAPEHVKDLVKIVNVYPLGLSMQEVRILKLLEEHNRLSMKALCSMTGLTNNAQHDAEKFLMRHGLMTVDGERVPTAKGREYLKALADF